MTKLFLIACWLFFFNLGHIIWFGFFLNIIICRTHLEMGGEIAGPLGVHEAGGSLCHCRTQSLSLLLVNCNIKSESISFAIPIAFVSVCFPEIASLSKYEQNVCLLQREASAAGSASSAQVQPCLKSSLEKKELVPYSVDIS